MAVVIPRPLAAAPSKAAYSARSNETPATPTPPMSLPPRKRGTPPGLMAPAQPFRESRRSVFPVVMPRE